MKKFLMAVAVLACATLAYAGPNAGGTLVVHDAALTVLDTVEGDNVCGLGTIPADCASIDAEIDGAVGNGDESFFKVYAAFLPGSSPRLMGIQWGVTYDAGVLMMVGSGVCGDFELNDPTWPASGSGSSVTWNTVQTAYLVPVYWFAAYNYYAAPTVFATAPHPAFGGNFGDDSVPAVIDPIAGYSTLGFDTPGTVVCPVPQIVGACCIGLDCTITTETGCSGTWQGPDTVCQPNPCIPPPPTGVCCTGEVCTITIEADCVAPAVWHGDLTSCDPNPCVPPTPTEKATWGTIKNIYR